MIVSRPFGSVRRSALRAENRFVRHAAPVLIVAASAIACGSHDSSENTGSSTSEALNTSPTLPNFVLYAQRSLAIGSHDSVSGGDLGVRLPTTSTFGPQLTVSDHVAIASNHNLLSPSVSLGGNSVVGGVQTNSLTNNGAILSAQSTFPGSAMPFEPIAPASAGGTTNIAVASHQATTLHPGNYGTLTIGDHAAVSLSPGMYSFSSVTISQNTSISASGGAVTFQIAGSLSIGAFCAISAGGGAGSLTVSVSGGDASSSSPAVSVGAHSSITALIAAPSGTISVSDHVSFTGALAAYDIAVSNNTSISISNRVFTNNSRTSWKPATERLRQRASGWRSDRRTRSADDTDFSWRRPILPERIGDAGFC